MNIMSPPLVGGLIVATIFLLISVEGHSLEQNSEVRQHKVLISGFKFEPKELRVSHGDQVTWINKDVVTHNIVTSSSQKAVSSDLASGEKFTFVVKGSLAYECGFHPSMKGKLITP